MKKDMEEMDDKEDTRKEEGSSEIKVIARCGTCMNFKGEYGDGPCLRNRDKKSGTFITVNADRNVCDMHEPMPIVKKGSDTAPISR